jgi:ABC-type Fe3+ transport system substrate-binding protein
MMAERTAEAMKPKEKTKFIIGDPTISGAGFVHAGTVDGNAHFGKFIVRLPFLVLSWTKAI